MNDIEQWNVTSFYLRVMIMRKRESVVRLDDAWLSRKYPYTASKAAVHCANRFTPTVLSRARPSEKHTLARSTPAMAKNDGNNSFSSSYIALWYAAMRVGISIHITDRDVVLRTHTLALMYLKLSRWLFPMAEKSGERECASIPETILRYLMNEGYLLRIRD